MKRLIYQDLIKWKSNPRRKSLILRGARQVGKTYIIREFSKCFDSFVEINLEKNPELIKIFETDLNPQRIINELSIILNKKIVPGKTLLFLDEIQVFPRALIATRYFYEELPELHVIAAGSLLDFAIEEVGIPVGRVTFMYLYPMNFIEFLIAKKHHLLAQEILAHNPENHISELIHEKLLKLLAEYFIIGGMPEAVRTWIETSDIQEVNLIHKSIIQSYEQDFEKYCKKTQIKYVALLFKQIPLQLGEKFKFSKISENYRKRELAPCLELLIKAKVIERAYHSDANGIPLGAEINLNAFKILYMDIALAQNILGYNPKTFLLDVKSTFINKGALTESFIGQEILSYSPANNKIDLFYWHRDKRSSNAEVDYVINLDHQIYPLEVKSNKGSTLTSLKIFLEIHKNIKHGIRFSIHNYSIFEDIHSYPLYAVASLMRKSNENIFEFVKE